MFSTFSNSSRAIGYCAAVALPMLLSAATGKAAEGGSNDPIKLAMNEWTSQNLLTQIAGRILSKAGYTVEYVTAGYTTQLTALSSGELTATMEVWETNVGEGFAKMVQDRQLTIVGENGLSGGGGWLYPEYVEEQCPGLPSWEALKKCTSLFATPETLPQGQIIDFPPEWGNMHTQDRLQALGIDLKPVSGGSEGAMLTALRSSVATKVPVLVYLWWPHPIFAELKLKHIELPAWAPECETDPKWGPNPDATFDCGEGPGKIVIAAWPGMEQKWPRAYKILQSFKIGNEEDMNLSHSIESGQKLGAVADTWMSDHQDLWKKWIADAGK